jgi:hypothetical protein
MQRNYKDGIKNDVNFFIGNEVEHTPAFGMRTMFVTGVHNIDDIENIVNEENSKLDRSYHIKHIFFGANHSFNPQTYEEHKLWEEMIFYFLRKDYLCSLDIPINQVEEFHESGYCEYDNFIPQIRVPIPYIKLWNYNTMVKIDDKDFKATNPGVWSHSLHTLMNRNKFTDWSQYNNDEIVK